MASHSCSICFVTFELADSLLSTYCGHVFHELCLLRWVKSSPTCPHCRKNTKIDDVHKIYLNIVYNNTLIEKHVGALQEKVNSLHRQIKSNNVEIDFHRGNGQKYRKQTIGLQNEIYGLSAEINQKDCELTDLRQQVTCLEKLKIENENLKANIMLKKEHMDSIEKKLNAKKSICEQYENTIRKVQEELNLIGAIQT